MAKKDPPICAIYTYRMWNPNNNQTYFNRLSQIQRQNAIKENNLPEQLFEILGLQAKVNKAIHFF